MPDNQNTTDPQAEAATHPEAGSGLKSPEAKSFGEGRTDEDRKLEGAMGGGGDGPDPASADQLDANTAVQGDDGSVDRQADYGSGVQNAQGPRDRDYAASPELADRLPQEAVSSRPSSDQVEIAADDAGASAMSEAAQKRAEGMENDG